jgi:hypothetical protein
MIGNEVGVCAVDKVDETLLGTVVTDTANGFTVSAADIRNFRVGLVIDALTKTTGAVGAGFVGRVVQSVDNVTNTVVYTGADATLTTLFGIYLTGQWELAQPPAVPAGGGREDYANLNGGLGVGSGFDNFNFGSIDAMRARLTAISATTYSATELDKMTMNDMIYAIRVNDQLGSIKG